MIKILILAITLVLIPKEVKAGLDKFSYLDKVQDWIIERKVDSITQNLSCRASIPLYATWFGSRIRLDKEDVLIVKTDDFNVYTDNTFYKNIVSDIKSRIYEK